MKCNTGPLYEGVRNSYSFIWGMWSQQRRQVEFAKAIVERVLDTPNDGVRYMGFVPAQNMKDVTASIRHKVYQQWDASSESPPQSRPAETTETTAPPLQVLAFQNGRPVFPNSLLSRFDADSREHQQILEKKVELELLFPPPAAGDPVATAGQPGRASGNCDFSVDNGLQPLDPQRDVSLVTVTEDQFTDARPSVLAVPISCWITSAKSETSLYVLRMGVYSKLCQFNSFDCAC